MSAQWGHGFNKGLHKGKVQGSVGASLVLLAGVGLVGGSKKLMEKRRQKVSIADSDQSTEGTATDSGFDE